MTSATLKPPRDPPSRSKAQPLKTFLQRLSARLPRAARPAATPTGSARPCRRSHSRPSSVPRRRTRAGQTRAESRPPRPRSPTRPRTTVARRREPAGSTRLQPVSGWPAWATSPPPRHCSPPRSCSAVTRWRGPAATTRLLGNQPGLPHLHPALTRPAIPFLISSARPVSLGLRGHGRQGRDQARLRVGRQLRLGRTAHAHPLAPPRSAIRATAATRYRPPTAVSTGAGRAFSPPPQSTGRAAVPTTGRPPPA